MRRRDDRWDRAIDALDPIEDADAIVRILVDHVFPLDYLFVAEITQLRTFSIPSISALLHKTRQYEDEGPRRLDDTKAILSDILVESGVHTEAGREMVEHLNAIHGHYRIRNDDFLYTLTSMATDGYLWLEEHGWRRMRPHELTAVHTVYRELGERMHIADIPQDFEGMLAWRQAYEDAEQRYAPSNAAVATAFLEAAKGLVPAMARPLLRPVVGALLEPRLRTSLGLSTPARGLPTTLRTLLRLRRRIEQRVDLWQDRAFSETAFYRHYPSRPDGFSRFDLGPTKIVSRLRR